MHGSSLLRTRHARDTRNEGVLWACFASDGRGIDSKTVGAPMYNEIRTVANGLRCGKACTT
jgi:hypothetical protein